MNEQSTSPAAGPIVARAGSYYRRARYLVCGMIFVVGVWFCYDGFVRYPAYNQKFAGSMPQQQTQMVKPYDSMSLLIQRGIGIGLPPLGVLLMVFFLYRSRGEYRLENQTLYVPGHPPVPMDRITELDRARWDRKGILVVHYALDDQTAPANLKLDDFIYERKPTDAIVDVLIRQLFPEESAKDQSPAA